MPLFNLNRNSAEALITANESTLGHDSSLESLSGRPMDATTFNILEAVEKESAPTSPVDTPAIEQEDLQDEEPELEEDLDDEDDIDDDEEDLEEDEEETFGEDDLPVHHVAISPDTMQTTAKPTTMTQTSIVFEPEDDLLLKVCELREQALSNKLLRDKTTPAIAKKVAQALNKDNITPPKGARFFTTQAVLDIFCKAQDVGIIERKASNS